jgi:hypothetical protein
MPDGSILVTDLLNHCIRKIKNGIVSTLAGNPTLAGADDGAGAQARFTNPIAITVDDSGVVYVADYLIGIRRIDVNGNVSTIPVPGPVATGYVGIGANGAGATLTLFVTIHGAGLEVIKPSQNYAKRWPTAEPEVVLDNARGIAALNDDEALITDIEANVVRLGYAPEAPFWGHAMAHVLVGSQGVSGMLDGPADLAQFDRPVGIAVHGHQVAVADAGNRRIRRFALPDVRQPLSVSRLDELADTKYYRIILIAPSVGFYGSTPETSIGGRLEAQLNRDKARIGLPKPARVWTARIDGLTLAGAQSWISNFVNEGQADLVIVTGVSSQAALADNSIAPNSVRAGTAAQIRAISALLRSRHIEFFGLAWPSLAWSSPVEAITWRDFNSDLPYANNLNGGIQADLGLIEAFKMAGVPYVAPLDGLLAAEGRSIRVPLAFPSDPHPNDLGNAFVARELTKALEHAKPWRQR